jgi:7-cyano-7-deazaguanine synthase in queuosine biosynthesis
MVTSRPVANVLVEDEFTERAKSLFSFQNPLLLSFYGPKQNLENGITKIESSIGKKLHPLVLDLYNIALVTYVCDTQFWRPDIEPRDIAIVMTVSNKDKWDNVRQHLEAMLRFLTGDSFTFHFVQGAQAKENFDFRVLEDKSIVLFSGGLDSLAGVKWLVDRNEPFMLISHPAMALIDKTQDILVQELRKILERNIEWHQIRATAKRKKGLRGKEMSQRSRSFLYLTLASIFALSRGAKKIYIFENGVLALNIPLSQARINENTRTVHPSFIRRYVELIQTLFGTSLFVENPFLQMTKAEVIQRLDCDEFRDLVKITISCSQLGRLKYIKGINLKEIRHCGVCFPCIIRRLSMHNAGLWNHDAKYKENILGEFSDIPEEGKKILFEIMDFARRVEACTSLDDIFIEFPQFYADESVDPPSLVEMTRRHLKEVKECIIQRGSESLKQSLQI